jgi:hypothetical protein
VIFKNSVSGQSWLPPSFSGAAGNESVPNWTAPEPEHGTCGWQLKHVIEGIESGEVKELVRVVFQDILRLLECLGLIESHLRQVDSAGETFALFQLIHDEARSLVEFIRTDALNCAGLDEELADTLDGITFVINHDLQRVFENDTRTDLSQKATHVILSEVHRAYDVLTNCLQQSTISLAMVFDRSLVGSKLFDNSDVRHKQSLQLCQDLLTLHQLVETSNSTNDVNLSALMAGITRFQLESLEYLMYSDWPQFESFCERIRVSTADSPSLTSVLHQFQCYLETLLGQVRLRAVLADQSQPSFESLDSAAVVQEPTSLSTDPQEAPLAFSL